MSEAIGLPAIALLCLVVPAVWIVGVIFIGSRPRRLLLWTVPFVIFYSAPIIAVTAFGRYQLTLEFLDVQRKPISGMPITYERSVFFGWFGFYVRRPPERASTDSSGRLIIPANHNQSLEITTATAVGSRGSSITLTSHGPSQPHYLSTQRSDVFVRHPSGARPDYIPPSTDIDLLVTLNQQ